jgi:hypothetical protein
MTDLERYLRLATWGLWGEHRRTVRMELEAHVRMKAWKYEFHGLSEPEAITRTLTELGAPSAISVGMSEVYTMPYVFRNTLLAAILMTLGVGNLTAGVAQVVGTNRFPIEACAAKQESFQVGKTLWPCEQNSLWLSISSLRATLEAKGVKFSQPESSPVTGNMLWLRFPGASYDVTLQSEKISLFQTETGGLQSFQMNPKFISAKDFLTALSFAPVPVTISGWDNAQIRVGETSFALGAAPQVLLGDDFYNDVFPRSTLESLFPSLIPNRSDSEREDILFASTYQQAFGQRGKPQPSWKHTLKIKTAKRGEVYIVLSREGPTDLMSAPEEWQVIENIRRAFIAPVSVDGTITYTSLSKTLTVSSDTNLPRCMIGGAGTISVLRFTGRIDAANPNNLVKVPAADVMISN